MKVLYDKFHGTSSHSMPRQYLCFFELSKQRLPEPLRGPEVQQVQVHDVLQSALEVVTVSFAFLQRLMNSELFDFVGKPAG
jgi:hypothetical protein